MANPAVEGEDMRTFEVRSPDMGRGDRMLAQYTDEEHGGRNHSLPLHIDSLPPGTRSVAWMLVDRNSDFVHWLVVDVPPGDIRLEEDASRHSMPPGSRELFNDAGYQGYRGPDPTPRTGVHRYELVAYALDTATLDLEEHAGAEAFRRAAEPHAVGRAENYWVYDRG